MMQAACNKSYFVAAKLKKKHCWKIYSMESYNESHVCAFDTKDIILNGLISSSKILRRCLKFCHLNCVKILRLMMLIMVSFTMKFNTTRFLVLSDVFYFTHALRDNRSVVSLCFANSYRTHAFVKITEGSRRFTWQCFLLLIKYQTVFGIYHCDYESISHALYLFISFSMFEA